MAVITTTQVALKKPLLSLVAGEWYYNRFAIVDKLNPIR